jgi:M6 family metalloprotease-like protein
MHRIFSGLAFCLAALVALAGAAAAHSPPTEEELSTASQASDFADRLRRIQRTEPHKLGEGLRERAAFKLTRALLETSGLPQAEQDRLLFSGPMKAFPYEAQPELRASGDVRVLVLLINFADYSIPIDAKSIEDNLFGLDIPAAAQFAPYESLRQYYHRASEGTLNITGTVLRSVTLPKKRKSYEPIYPPNISQLKKNKLDRKALFALITKALKAAAPAGFDFSQFDNDGDRDIDLIHVIYAGPRTGWGTFWWAYRWSFNKELAETQTFGGQTLNQFIFQDAGERGDKQFNPHTAIHEVGHALGLPDLYDYCSVKKFKEKKCPREGAGPGPDGAIGGLDMMAANMGNHNALSRWFLDWINPTVVRPGMPTRFTLVPSGGDVAGIKALAIFPGLQQTNAPGQELFIIENRKRVGNDGKDARMPSDGLLIWHVDSTPRSDGTDLAYDNSYTDHLMIRLVRARTSDMYFADGVRASARDYFVPGLGLEFGPTSVPPSTGYDKRRTNVFVRNIVATGDLITLDVGFYPDKVASAPAAPADPSVSRPAASPASSGPEAAVSAVDVVGLERLEQELSTAKGGTLAERWARQKQQIDLSGAVTQGNLVAELILTKWASRDGEAAARALLEMPPSPFVREAFPRVMRAWARKHPKAAGDWYFAAEQEKIRGGQELAAGEGFTRILFGARAEASPESAADMIKSLRRPGEIFGAVRGLSDAAAKVGAPASIFDQQLQGLPANAKEALALKDLHLSLQKVGGLKDIEALGGKENYILRRIEDHSLGYK